MSNGKWLWIAIAVGLSAMVGGCNCSSKPAGGGDAGNGDGGRRLDGGPGGGDGGPVCLQPGSACGGAAPCCSGTCNGGVCVSICGAPGTACTAGNQCCTGRCDTPLCSATQCSDVGQGCATNNDCCTLNCVAAADGGKACDVLPGQTCNVIGQTCASGPDCCSTNCQGGHCAPAFTCQANGDICTSNAECCSKNCQAPDGGAGLCVQTGGTGGGNCNVDGNPCSGPSTCCSRICADPGSGATVCVVGEGCILTGDPCSSTLQCCGGVDGGGGVMCTGKCDNGTACNPEGNICGAGHLRDGGIVKVNASMNCCFEAHPGDACIVDPAGIPRCYGQCPPASSTCDAGCLSITGLPGCCLSPGDHCNLSGECCNNVPCVPNDAGVLTCTVQTCLPVGTNCVADAGTACCSGTQCLPTGELGTACQVPATGTDGGGPTCEANGAACDAGASCCSKICNGTCQQPASCQPQGTVCTLSADCCAGLTCTNGTCQTGGTCAQVGQVCTVTSAADGGAGTTCCPPLSCLNPATGAPCNGTTTCNCSLLIQ